MDTNYDVALSDLNRYIYEIDKYGVCNAKNKRLK